MTAFIPKSSKKVLDCGCGEGYFGAEVKKQFLSSEVWGLELDKQSAELARKKIDNVLQGNLEDTIGQLPKNYFDCITFNDVLEHLVNPYEIISRLRENLSDHVRIISIWLGNHVIYFTRLNFFLCHLLFFIGI